MGLNFFDPSNPLQEWAKILLFWRQFLNGFDVGRFLSSVKMANREQKNVSHDEENPVIFIVGFSDL